MKPMPKEAERVRTITVRMKPMIERPKSHQEPHRIGRNRDSIPVVFSEIFCDPYPAEEVDMLVREVCDGPFYLTTDYECVVCPHIAEIGD